MQPIDSTKQKVERIKRISHRYAQLSQLMLLISVLKAFTN